MKIRTGFVSNSSSSSFICDVCGNTESGMGASLSDFDMCKCENGHTMCDSHKINTTLTLNQKIDAILRQNTFSSEKELREKSENDIDDKLYGYSLPAEFCKICQMEALTDYDIIYYMLRKHGLTIKEVVAMAKEEFNGDYKAFKQAIKV